MAQIRFILFMLCSCFMFRIIWFPARSCSLLRLVVLEMDAGYSDLEFHKPVCGFYFIHTSHLCSLESEFEWLMIYLTIGVGKVWNPNIRSRRGMNAEKNKEKWKSTCLLNEDGLSPVENKLATKNKYTEAKQHDLLTSLSIIVFLFGVSTPLLLHYWVLYYCITEWSESTLTALVVAHHN